MAASHKPRAGGICRRRSVAAGCVVAGSVLYPAVSMVVVRVATGVVVVVPHHSTDIITLAESGHDRQTGGLGTDYLKG